MMRSFIALPLPEHIKTILLTQQEAFKQQGAKARWIQPDQMHLTLKFLGNITQTQKDALITTMEDTLKEYDAFELTLGAVGTFPNSRQPRVLWTGLTEEPNALAILAQHIEQSCRTLGFEPEERPYRPHITLGRTRTNTKVDLKSIPTQEASWTATQVTLFESELHPEGSIHTPVHVWNLKS